MMKHTSYMMKTAKFIVTGVVQGVGFRYHSKQIAIKLGLSGFAKNLPDRSVEVVVHGFDGSVSEMAIWLSSGPTMAKVENVIEQKVEQKSYSGFEIL
ncbi:acylphosphatase [Pseudoalteromonas sp. SMS1]|uniref:acylphosphatase n=1 Tax=Pseudoalteromonas sp. SMS1 TaxID=2908894 RepID=UPI001F2DDB4F|nr:acylphosphatase [Pseudoalteromonas sp. SMS1]MCF2858056.1 acylphosphatase [Pseudoalteromonas sp. SMS1]